MSFKVKIFSLIIIGLLLLPVLVSPSQTGEVLGVRETQVGQLTPAAPFVSQSGSSEIPRQSQLGTIASGARDVRTSEVATSNRLIGDILVDENAISAVSTDRFAEGTKLSVVTANGTHELTVTSTRILSPDTILVLDPETFALIGGTESEQIIFGEIVAQ